MHNSVVLAAISGTILILGACQSQRNLPPVSILPKPAAVPDSPPETKIDPVTETIHGVTLTDNYRWLEGDNADPDHMGKVDDEVAKWTDAQNAYTRAWLDNLPGRDKIEAEIRPLMEVGSVSAPGMYADRYFYSKREGTQNQPVYFYRDGYKGQPHELLDPAKLDASGLTTISWISPSHDGKLVAYGTYRAGDENSVLHLMNVDTGQTLPLEIPGKTEAPTWLPDSSGFVYHNLSDIKNPYSGQLKFHVMGQDPANDKLIFRQYTPEEDAKLATTWGPDGGLDKTGKWFILSYATGTASNDLWVINFDDWRKTGTLYEDFSLTGKQASSGIAEVVDDVAYMQTTYNSPNGRVVAIDLHGKNNGDESTWKTIVPERKDAVIQGVSIAGGRVAVTYMVNASTQIDLFDLTGAPKGTLRLPGIGTAGLSTEKDRSEAYLSFSSFNYPPSIFRVDLASPDAEPELWERPDVPVNPDSAVVKQVWYTSKDGTKVSMFIVHKKGLNLNGDNPTILYGYGGFNIPMTPGFSATLFQWLDWGGVYAIANLRGGGEYGENWHTSGMLDKKQNVFDDFAAAAEYLEHEGYTRPERLAIRGGSNGGLLTGTLVTQRPELFSAAIVAVPLLDMIRYQNFLMARYWVPEYGDPANAADFNWLIKYSPYQNVKPGTKYPAVYLTAGENDSRVHPGHARKFAAALRAADASDQNQKPILLWVDREAGHGQGKPLNLRLRDVVDERMFLMRQLGMLQYVPQGN
ncbi:MAG: prolyl oligopeptidase family serine peptidase [Tepidisphaera sp.]|nr:prolyl oligopeptidase family serine peptidase [Tepidisphaera sp.]